jgi:hypothetical protein
MMQWRKHLPDDCPPEDAIPTIGQVYRLADKNNFDENDFLSHRELHPEREWEGVSECVAGGISVYTELEGILRLRRRVKSMRRKKVISGVLEPKHGKMKHTPSETHPSHHTWWIPLDEKPWRVFRVIELNEDDNP